MLVQYHSGLDPSSIALLCPAFENSRWRVEGDASDFNESDEPPYPSYRFDRSMRQQWEKYREQERFKAIAKWALRSHLMMLNEGLEAKKETYCAKKSIQLIRFYQTNNIISWIYESVLPKVRFSLDLFFYFRLPYKWWQAGEYNNKKLLKTHIYNTTWPLTTWGTFEPAQGSSFHNFREPQTIS